MGTPWGKPPTEIGGREVLTATDAAREAGCSVRTIWNWVNAGKVEIIRTPGGRPLIYKDSLWKLHL